MRLALFINVAEGEYDIAWEALMSFVESCQSEDITVFILDDGSPSQVGKRLTSKFHAITHYPVDCLELPQSLGFRGNGLRAFLGLNTIANSGKFFDAIIKIDADALVIRRDLGDFIEQVCPNGIGLYGESYPMRWRDRLLYMADHFPVGFKRKSINGIIQRQWEFSRTHPVWWNDFGRKALLNGFRFNFIPACFWLLGGKTLEVLKDAGYLSRTQNKHGFVFNDDLLLTTAVYAINHPVIDLASVSSNWGRFMAINESTLLTDIKTHQPYVVHPLKDNSRAWEQRKEIKRLLEYQI